jgi:two-component system, chemotaxis family, response regulator Rcp1
MNTASSRPVEILLVEDNAADVRLTQEAFRESRIANRMHTVPTGDQALAFLHRRAPYVDATMPDLILLDWNLPGLSGREVLSAIKQDAKLRLIPVVILTTSQAQEDILKAYNLNANCYVSKPVDFEQFVRVVHAIDGFWLAVVKLPPIAD